MSNIGWVDFSSTDRERVLQVLAMLKEPGTLDELGIGQIRDAFADSLFPGFSTIQTRAKYFVAVPRLFRDYQKLSKRERNRQSLDNYLKEQENKVAEVLVKKHANQDTKTTGIIGATRVEQGGVARRPSSVYWNGLRQFGIVDTNLSLAEFCRKYGSQISHYQVASGDDGSDDSDAMEQKKLVHIARTSHNWLAELDINLTKEEASFLRDKIRHSRNVQHSIPAQLFNALLLEEALDVKLTSFGALSDWLKSKSNVSDICRKQAILAQQFSLAMEGAHIRYNCLIAAKVRNVTRLNELNERYMKWHDLVMGVSLFHDDAATAWISAAQRENPKLKSRAESFVRSWCRALIDKSSVESLNKLVEGQAYLNKGNRSVLKKQFDQDPGWVGMDKLDYRWTQVRNILSDIAEGLTC
ncbi:MAG: DUF6361 family protein [Desulfocapsaceae bacterium]|nr:DUF6361 family protein [Desulfocapsaceae bacterium]